MDHGEGSREAEELLAALGLEEEGLGHGKGLECPPSPCVRHK